MNKQLHRSFIRREQPVSRRSFLAGAASFAVATTLPSGRAQAQTTGATFDYYISPTGSDSNPGTQAQPWAITAINSKQTAYAGKRVGLLNGTYNVSSFPATSAQVLLEVAGGRSGSPTVIGAVNARQAIITAKNGSSYNGSGPIIGSGVNGAGSRSGIQYVTIQDLEILGSSYGLIAFDSDAGAGTQPGIVIQNCLLHDMVNPSGASNHGGISLGTSLVGALVQNCHIYDCYEAGISRTTHGNASAIYDWAINTTIQYCTIHDCTSAVYQKNQGWGPPQGETFRYNYVYFGTSGMNCMLDGFNNASVGSPPYQPNRFYGNIFELGAAQGRYNSNSGATGYQASTYFYNNTIWFDGAGKTPGWQDMILTPAAVAAGCRLYLYNNIVCRPSGSLTSANGAWGDMTADSKSWSVWDYNLWPIDVQLGLSGSDTTYPSSLMTLSQWQAQSGSPDAHSIVGAPTFANKIVAGGGTAQYKLASGSIGKGAGRVGGVAAGAVTDIGAWGAGSSQIGSNFAAGVPLAPAPTPDAPILTVS